MEGRQLTTQELEDNEREFLIKLANTHKEYSLLHQIPNMHKALNEFLSGMTYVYSRVEENFIVCRISFPDDSSFRFKQLLAKYNSYEKNNDFDYTITSGTLSHFYMINKIINDYLHKKYNRTKRAV